MRRVACYAAVSNFTAGERSVDVLNSLVAIIRTWLKVKGLSDAPEGKATFVLPDGREATAFANKVTVGEECAWELTLDEPTETGRFFSRICLGLRLQRLYLFLELRAGGDGSLIAPVQVDVRCPQVLRDLLSKRIWHVGQMPVSTTPLPWFGEEAAGKFIAVVRHRDRNLPLIAISQHYGQMLVPSLADDVSRDLSGLATIVQLDGAASWAITKRYGREWSCYNGSIRMYWPIGKSRDSAFDHPLWTRERLIEEAGNATAAASRIRSQLRRRLIELSTYTFDEQRELIEIRDAAARARFDALAAEASAKGDQAELAEHYFNETARLERRVNEDRQKIDALQDQVRGLLDALRHLPGEATEEIAPEPESPVNSVEEAVRRANEKFGNVLTFGGDVEHSIYTVATDAGPPDKIFQNLRTLAEMTEARNGHGLGRDMIMWLRDQGARASNESETVVKNDSEMEKRTWDDGSGKTRRFEKHLKPKNATSPDQCVRIYFDYDPATKKTIVGWVGAHP